MKEYHVYIITNWNNKVMYIGVTNNLERRLYEHKNHLLEGFTKKYKINRLVHFETFGDIELAIQREKELKGWLRDKKNELVYSNNPNWTDLSERWYYQDPSLRSG
jgi:putative endonuclease